MVVGHVETDDMVVAWVGENWDYIFRFMSFDHLLWLQKCAAHIGNLEYRPFIMVYRMGLLWSKLNFY